MDHNQYHTESPEPASQFISPAEKFRVPPKASFFKPETPRIGATAPRGPIAIPTGKRSSALAKKFAQSRSSLDALIAKDARWRKENPNGAPPQENVKVVAPPPPAQADAYDSCPASQFVPTSKKSKNQRRKERHLGRIKKSLDKQRARAIEKNPLGWQAQYEAYIKSPAWRAFRGLIFAERGRKCQQCSAQKCVLHVHHLHYRNFKNEKSEDVLVLCEPCHAIIHHK